MRDRPRYELPGDELHIWRAGLDQPESVTARLEAELSPEERSRAGRFYFAPHGSRYVVGRGLLRVLLAGYTGVPPRELEFTYGEQGKPLLAGPGPWFNLAHSEGEAVFAFSSGAEVGVDIEVDDPRRFKPRLAERFFSPREVRSLMSLPEERRPRAFLSCWTRKEAFIKARGDGLSLPLRTFDVTLSPAEPPAVLRTEWSALEPAEWSMVDLSDPAEGVVAAAAGRHPGWRVVRRRADDLAGQLSALQSEST